MDHVQEVSDASELGSGFLEAVRDSNAVVSVVKIREVIKERIHRDSYQARGHEDGVPSLEGYARGVQVRLLP